MAAVWLKRSRRSDFLLTEAVTELTLPALATPPRLFLQTPLSALLSEFLPISIITLLKTTAIDLRMSAQRVNKLRFVHLLSLILSWRKR